MITIALKSHSINVKFLSTWRNFLCRDKLKEESRKRKLETYKETGSWPGIKKAKSRDTTPWSKSKEKNAKKHEKKSAKAQKKVNRKGLSEAEMLLLEKAFPGGEKV